MYCWDRQSSSRCPWSLIRTQRRFPFNSLQNLISSATLTLWFTEYFESTFPCVFVFWAFKGENRPGSPIASEKAAVAHAFCWPSTDEFILQLNRYANGAWKAVLAFPYISFGEINTIGFSTQLQHWVYFPSYYKEWHYKHAAQRPACFHVSALARQLLLATSFLGFTKGIVKQEAKSSQFSQHRLGSRAFRKMAGFAVHTLMCHIQNIMCDLGLGQILLSRYTPGKVWFFLLITSMASSSFSSGIALYWE